MSMISQHALNEYEAKENQQGEITSFFRTVNIFQALLLVSLPPLQDFYPLESQGVFKFSIFNIGLHLLKHKKKKNGLYAVN